MTATVLVVTNPFDRVAGRLVLPIVADQTVGDLLTEAGIAPARWADGPEVLVDGIALPSDIFAVRVIRPGELVSVIRWPRGGGGGGGGKSPLRTILTIAVMVAAAASGGAAAGLIGLEGSATIFGSFTVANAVGGVLAMAGAALVNTVIPAPSAAIPSESWGSAGSSPAPSPTYSLQAQGNQGRLGQPIPVIYGRHQIYPDLAATPYEEYIDNDQYLFQLHVIGQGQYDIEKICIEDTPISSFDEVSTELIPPGATITLFDARVVTAGEVSGQELKAPNDLIAGSDGIIGPFMATAVGTQAGAIGVDMVMDRGLYYANDSGALDQRSISWRVEAQTVDDAGIGVGAWTLLGNHTVTNATTTPIRQSTRYPVTPGRYQVRAIRTDTKDTSSRAGHSILWAALRAYVPGQPDFGPVTLLAVKMRATDNLSARSSRKINVIVTRKLPVWSATGGWSDLQPTRSIAWAFANACRAEYGAKLADARLDLKALVALDAVWTARGDFFDAVFDSPVTVWEALARIARCGRAVPIPQGGVVRIVRDAPQTLPVAMFGPRNIVKGSFKLGYIMPGDNTADGVTVEYYSSVTWKPDDVTQALADSKLANPAKVTLFGCTGRDQAAREGLYMAANNRYRRRMITFSTELDGMIPTYGDLIAITHDMPRWGQGGEIVGYAGDRLDLSEPLDWTDGAPHYIALRRRDGGLAGPYKVAAVDGAPSAVRLVEPLTITPYIGGGEERTSYSFGPADLWARMARVLSIKPRGADTVQITAVAEDERVHVN